MEKLSLAMSQSLRFIIVNICILTLILLMWDAFKPSGKNTVCLNVGDYFNMETNPNCWFDADVNANVSEIIENHGYVSETHKVITEDGHILTIFRVVNKRSRRSNSTGKPVFLQHGITGSATNFVGIGKESLSFLLSDAGYDVWLGNSRGSMYSREHTLYNDTDYRYWNHSLHEMAIYDLPAVFNYINLKNNNKIIYLGFSMGTAQAFVYSSLFPEKAKSTIELLIMFSPVITNTVNHGFLTKYGGPFISKINFESFDLTWDFFTGKYNRIRHEFVPLFLQIKLAAFEFNILDVSDLYNMKPETIPKFLKHNAAGASAKALVHIFHKKEKFQMYDYGKQGNLALYQQEFPPEYNLNAVKVPVLMFYSDTDGVCSAMDVQDVYNTLREDIQCGIHRINADKFTHLDFAYGKDVKQLLYDPLLRFLSNFNGVCA